MRWGISITALGIGLILAGVGWAGMVQPEWQHTAAVEPSTVSRVPSDRDVPGKSASKPSDWGDLADPYYPVSGPTDEELVATPETADEQPAVYVLADDQDSLTFCLYGLLGLGFCKSLSSLRRASLYHIPEWYHDGGPYQVGHSLAVAPTCVCHAPICFVQPEPPADEPLLHYRFGTVASLLRNSQQIPTILSPRGPPA